jgi:hypothetical protein
MPVQATSRSTKLVLIPGWNESAEDLRVLANGRSGHAGLANDGYDHVVFADGEGSLTDRIRQFGTFLAELKAREPEAFPVATLGYSAGGLINRGFLRAFPERAGEVGSVVQVGTPNWGLVTDNVALLLNAMHLSRSVIADIDIESPFMAWLNDTPGHWEPIPGSDQKRWVLDRPPAIAPAGSPAIINILGRVPGCSVEGDELVDVRSGTLDGAVAHSLIDDPHANHLNLSGMWSIVTWLLRRWSCDDRVWPVVVQRASAFLGGPPGVDQGEVQQPASS